MCKGFSVNINKEGYIFIAISLFVSFLATSFSLSLGLFFLLLTLYICYFFRDPDIKLPGEKNILISPAHGLVTKIEHDVSLPESLDKSKKIYTRVSIFLSIFDIHVNRIPVDGVVTKLNYVAGKFLSATLDKSSTDNERQEILIEAAAGEKIAVVQIAGLIARRIVCNLKENDQVQMGERFGVIRFGSRVDIYFSTKYELNVQEGQTMVGGETIVARLKSKK
jgi:phosphatidylserine decarboxylase